MRLVLLALAVAAAALVWRRRRGAGARVHLAWRDGAELDLPPGSADHAQLVALAGKVLA